MVIEPDKICRISPGKAILCKLVHAGRCAGEIHKHIVTLFV